MWEEQQVGLDKICLAKFEQNGQPEETSNFASKMGCKFCQKSKMGCQFCQKKRSKMAASEDISAEINVIAWCMLLNNPKIIG